MPPISLQPAASGHVDGSLYNNDSFAVHLRREKGYNVGQFGKSNFNTCEGFNRWFQGAFLGYGGGWQDNEAANFSYHGKPNEYATALIGNKSVEWLHRPEITGAQSEGRPFFLCAPTYGFYRLLQPQLSRPVCPQVLRTTLPTHSSVPCGLVSRRM